MKPHIKEEFDELRTALTLIGQLQEALDKPQYRGDWGVSGEVLEEMAFSLRSRFGWLVLANEAQGGA